MIRVLIADDHPLVRTGLRQILARHEDMNVIGEAEDYNGILALLRDAESSAGAIRAEARAEGYAAGKSAGYAEGRAAAVAEHEQLTALLHAAASGADAIRAAALSDVERQAVDLALAAATKIVGVVAQSHGGLAAEIVRAGIRGAPGRVLRVRVHPRDVEPVTAVLLTLSRAVPVEADTLITAGGAIIDIEGGIIDLTLGAQLDSISRVFRAAA